MPASYVYILVCTDLPLAQQMVQAGHAALECGQFLTTAPPPVPDNIVLAQVPDEEALLAEAARLAALPVPPACRIIREPDLGGRATALVCGPLSGAARRPFRGWKLWTPESSHAEVA